MKKLKKAIIFIIICLSSFISTSVFAADTAKISEETVRLRSKASTDSAIVTLISMNEEVQIIEKSGEWYKVKYKGKTGYIKETLLKIEDKATEKENNTTTENDANVNQNNNEQNATSNEEKEPTNKNENETKPEQVAENNNDENNVSISEGYKEKINGEIELRILPLINSNKIASIKANTDIEVIEVFNNWCSIKSDTQYGWVLKSQLENLLQKEEKPVKTEDKKEEEKDTNTKTETKTTKKGYVNVNTVNVRKEKSTSSEILTNLSRNAEVEVIKEADNWSQVKVNGIIGYIASKYISDQKVEVTSRGTEESRQTDNDKKDENTTTNQNIDTTSATNTTQNESVTQETTKPAEKIDITNTGATNNVQADVDIHINNDEQQQNSAIDSNTQSATKGSEVVEYAKKYLGKKYVSGGSTPATGFDCSGFTSYVYKHFGKTLSRTSSGQRSNGTAVKSKSDLKQGDIVCFKGHVGIYIGNNKFIHAANPKKGVIITSLSNSYYVKTYITARRIL